jgi:hypothetical protein
MGLSIERNLLIGKKFIRISMRTFKGVLLIMN